LGDNNLFVRSLILPSNILNENLSQIDILYKIIQSGTSASYTTTKTKHELIGTDLYTHATSPLRRASDCIVHFLLKAKYLEKESPFSKDELETMANKLTHISKQLKNLQYMDNKLRTFQWMAEELEKNNNINIKIKVNSYKAPFLNLLIISINNMNVNISYTLKRKKYDSLKTDIVNVSVLKVNIYDKFDEGTLPDIDLLF
jgi:ribonuclease R